MTIIGIVLIHPNYAGFKRILSYPRTDYETRTPIGRSHDGRFVHGIGFSRFLRHLCSAPTRNNLHIVWSYSLYRKFPEIELATFCEKESSYPYVRT